MTFVACGEAHSGAIDSNGLVWTWGAGAFGRLGHSEPEDTLIPKKIDTFEEMNAAGDLMPMQQVALGGCHSLFLEMSHEREKSTTIGKLFSCGCGAAVGLLSENDDSCVPVPRVIQDTKVFNSLRIVDMCAGMFHNLVLLEDGTLVCWGVGANGRLGDNKAKNVSHPQVLKSSSDLLDPKDGIGVAQFRGFALKRMGESEDEKRRTLQDPSEAGHSVEDVLKKIRQQSQGGAANSDPWSILQLGAGTAHTVALTRGGNLYVWGSNDNGQLGLGRDSNVSFEWTPRKLTIAFGNSTRLVKDIAVGSEHCVVVTHSADLWAWGKGQHGQLGTGRARNEKEPVLISAIQPYQVLTCAAGDEHSACIARRDKSYPTELFTWGSTENGMLGLGRDQITSRQVPARVTLEGGVVAAGKKKAKPAASPGIGVRRAQEEGGALSGPLLVACGQSHTAVITGSLEHLDRSSLWDDSKEMCRLWTCGGGWYGKLGLCNQDNYYQPMMVGVGKTGVAAQNRFALLNVSVKSVSCGTYHTSMVSKSGELYQWGRDTRVCEPEHLLAPKKNTSIEAQHKVANAICGEFHTFVVLETGEVWVWGENNHGQLGIGRSRRLEIQTPEQAKFAPGVINCGLRGAMATGPTHAVGLFANGEVWGWGNQSCGRLGLEDKDQNKLVMEPKRVQAVWRSVESMSSAVQARQFKSNAGHNAKDKEEAEKNFIKGALEMLSKESGKKQVVKDFATMQTLIRAEKKECQDKQLATDEKKLDENLKLLHTDISQLGSREEQLQQLNGELQHSLEKNLKYFKLPPPKIDDSWSEERFVACLPKYKEVLRALQAQPCYTAVLLANLKDPSERAVVYEVIQDLYADTRSHKTFWMLMRQMVVKELEPSGLVLFSLFRETSTVFQTFSRFALSPVHYKDLIWIYLRDLKDSKQTVDAKQQTLYMSLTSQDMYVNTFALSVADFSARKGKDTEERRDAALDQEAYRIESEKFRDFLMGPFVQSVVKAQLPDDICQFLHFVHFQCQQRQLELGKQMDAAISQELNSFTPSLRLFVKGILCPIMSDMQKYLGPQCYLPKRQQEEEIYENAAAVTGFLDIMLEDNFDPKLQKDLREAARIVRPELLRFVQDQVNRVKDTIQSELVMETYLGNYDIDPRTVSVRMGTLMKLTNLLKEHAEKMRLRDHDPLELSVRQIEDWDEDTLTNVHANAEDNRKYNFTMDHRFMVHETEEPLICRSCKCPMPARYGTRNSAPGMIIKMALAGEKKDPQKALEAVLRELPFIVTANSFESMRKEFEEKKGKYKEQGDIATTNLLTEGLRVLEELSNVQAYAEDVLKYMTQNLIMRSRHRNYLDEMERVSKKIDKVQERYTKGLKDRQREIELAVNFSIDLVLPKKFNEAATNGRTTLDFESKSELLKKKQPVNPKEMPAGCSFSPLVTLKMTDMKRKEILAEVHHPFNGMERKMEATFETLKSGSVQITIGIAQRTARGPRAIVGHAAGNGSRNILTQMVVDANTLATFQRMDATATVDLGEPAFLKVFAFRFHTFVTVELSKKVAFK